MRQSPPLSEAQSSCYVSAGFVFSRRLRSEQEQKKAKAIAPGRLREGC